VVSGKLIQRSTFIFLIGIAFAEGSMSLTMVQISVYLRELGAQISEVGLYFTLALVFSLTFRVFGGWLSDVVDRLRVITLGCFVGVFTFLIFAFVPLWQYAIIGALFLAITTALTVPAYYAHIADQTEEDKRGRVFGIAQTVRLSAWVLAPPLGGLIAQNLGYRWMFLTASLLYAIAALIFVALSNRMRPAVHTQSPNFRQLRKSIKEMVALFLAGGIITWILIVDGVRDIAFNLSFDLMPVYLSDIAGMSKGQIGLLDGIFGLAAALTIYPAGWLADRTSERLVITAGLIGMILSRLVFSFAVGFSGFAASWILLAIGGSMLTPAGSSLISKTVPKHLRGMTYGLFATSLGIFALPAPWVGSQFWELINPRAPFLITVVLGSLVILPAWHKLSHASATENPIETTPEKTRTKPSAG
jgi:MFS family permease